MEKHPVFLLGTLCHLLLREYLRAQEILAGTCLNLIPMHSHSLTWLHRDHLYIQNCVSKFLIKTKKKN
jgi:hypothetical protein